MRQTSWRRALLSLAATVMGVSAAAAAISSAVGPDRHSLGPIQRTRSVTGGEGYWLVATDGGIFSYGDAAFFGSTGAIALNKPIVGMSPTPTGKGYWLVASDGGIFSFGDATFFGSTGAIALNKPIVGMSPTPTGRGYWLVATDGGIFSFGDATFFGSTGDINLNRPIAGMASTPTGTGYWLVASDGGIFTFGDAPFFGSGGSTSIGAPVLALTTSPTGLGYRMAAANGRVLAFGDSASLGSTSGPLNAPVVGMGSSPDGAGYRLVSTDGGIFAFGDAPFLGSRGGEPLNRPIVGMATTPRVVLNVVPLAVDDQTTTNEDTAVRVGELANDLGLDDGGITVDLVTNPTSGVAVVNADRSITYTPTGDTNGFDRFRYRVTDVDGDTSTAEIAVTVTPVNDPPTAIGLADAAVDENSPIGTVVGSFTTADVDDTVHTYSLVAGAGSTDNASFTIDGAQLKTAAIFDRETKSGYTVRVRSTDAGGLTFEQAFTITVTDVNDAPTDIAISNSTVAENAGTNAAVGTFTTTDPDAGATHTYTLVAGAGDTDNSAFNISGDALRANASFDFETRASYTVRVRTTDSGGLTFEEAFTVTVTDANEAPTDIALSNSTIAENADPAATVGTLTTSDVDALD
ncbi:MAG: Ig-like domain-containing protein, partial [Actinomycetota bacterium]|nr:Ig-like domain-containing protein [Actinomycetota bacterium]